MEEYSEKNIKELENQLLSKIGYFSPRKKDAVQYEKVNRYIYLVKLLYELKAKLHEDGLVVNQRMRNHNRSLPDVVFSTGEFSTSKSNDRSIAKS